MHLTELCLKNMSEQQTKFLEERNRIRKQFISILIVMIICAVLLVIGIILHNTDIEVFFGVLEGIFSGVMLMVGAEKLEFNKMYLSD